jgi:hypothetical protein
MIDEAALAASCLAALQGSAKRTLRRHYEA